MQRMFIQFAFYIASGATAAVVDYGSYMLLLTLDTWYIAASVAGSALGFLTAFLMHKYVVFKKRDRTARHLVGYLLADLLNIVLTTGILYALVEWVGIGEELAKILAMGSVVLWNFFICKFLVFV